MGHLPNIPISNGIWLKNSEPHFGMNKKHVGLLNYTHLAAGCSQLSLATVSAGFRSCLRSVASSGFFRNPRELQKGQAVSVLER